MDNMTPADVMAMTRNNDNDGFFGGNGFYGIIVLFFIFALFGGGGFGATMRRLRARLPARSWLTASTPPKFSAIRATLYATSSGFSRKS